MLEVVNELVRTLLVPQRVKAAAERVKIGDGDSAVSLYRETVRAMQERLVEAGFLKGKADGAFGPGTEAAVRRSRRRPASKATGIPDRRTLMALFYGGPARQRPGRSPARRAPAAPAPAPAPRRPAAGQARPQPGPEDAQ